MKKRKLSVQENMQNSSSILPGETKLCTSLGTHTNKIQIKGINEENSLIESEKRKLIKKNRKEG